MGRGEGGGNHKMIPYTWNFSRCVNFTDFAVSRAAVKILPPHIIKEYVAREFVV